MIFMYRDGIGGPSMQTKALAGELEQMVESIKGYAQGYNPKIMYCFVDKRITHRLFEKANGNGYVNPAPGTCIDTGLVER